MSATIVDLETAQKYLTWLEGKFKDRETLLTLCRDQHEMLGELHSDMPNEDTANDATRALLKRYDEVVK